MTFTQMRWSGWILFSGALLMVLITLFDILIPAPPVVIIAAMEIIAGLLIAVGLPATYLKQRHALGNLGQAGFFMLWIASLITSLVVGIAIIVIFVTTNTNTPTLPATVTSILSLFGLVNLIGIFLYGSTTLRGRVFAPAIGWLLVSAVIVNAIDLVLGGVIAVYLSIVSNLLLQVGLARLGYALARSEEELPILPEPENTNVDDWDKTGEEDGTAETVDMEPENSNTNDGSAEDEVDGKVEKDAHISD